MAGRNKIIAQLSAKTPRTRAHASDRATRPPFQPGNSFSVGHGRPRRDHKELYAEVLRIAREYSPEAMRRMIALAETSESDHVRMVALATIMERAYGKPKEFDPEKEADGGIDFAKMSDTDLAALIGILRRSSPATEVEGEVVDSETDHDQPD
jgi:hypothetical protein